MEEGPIGQPPLLAREVVDDLEPVGVVLALVVVVDLSGVISRNVEIFGLGIGPHSLMDPVDPASPVAVVHGEVKGEAAAQ